jgi:uncharacterized Zn-binding protein involved in type VI secretion
MRHHRRLTDAVGGHGRRDGGRDGAADPDRVISAPCFPPVIVGFPPSARVLDLHACALDLPLPNTITTGSSTVLIGGLHAARISDKIFCSAEVRPDCPTC